MAVPPPGQLGYARWGRECGSNTGLWPIRVLTADKTGGAFDCEFLGTGGQGGGGLAASDFVEEGAESFNGLGSKLLRHTSDTPATALITSYRPLQ